jgi:hypothetical protein
MVVLKFKILGSECQTSSKYAKRAKQTTKKDVDFFYPPSAGRGRS